MPDINEDSPKSRYESAFLENQIAYRMRAYGHINKMSEIDILYITVAALASENKRLLQMMTDIVARKPVGWIIPAHATVHFPGIRSIDEVNTD
mgnify:FL=1